jgi:hypothetical protein
MVHHLSSGPEPWGSSSTGVGLFGTAAVAFSSVDDVTN